MNDPASLSQESQREEYAVSELQRRLEVSVSLSNSGLQIVDELEDGELLELASGFMGDNNEQVLHSHPNWFNAYLCIYIYSTDNILCGQKN